MNQMKWMMASAFAVLLSLVSWGCAGTAGKAIPQNAVTGKHPAAWIQNHWAEYVRNPVECRTCHGSTSDPAQAGGISKVSCFKCHAKSVDHPAGWAGGDQHGLQGAMLGTAAQAGFAYCAKCHGDIYDNGLAVSCKTCHTTAPHPAKPWNGTTSSHSSHADTASNNAPECLKCHANGANSTRKPAVPAPAGTAPGCYNATLCHG